MQIPLTDDIFSERLDNDKPHGDYALEGNVEMPNLRHLKSILLVGELQSVNRAAEVMNLSQPAITQAISSIELEFGRSLFQRHPTGMFVTPAGNILKQRLAGIFDILDSAIGAAKQNSVGGKANKGDSSLLLRSGQLQVLVALSQSGNFETSADILGKSIASIQRNLRNLEDRICSQLVLREGAFVHLTRAGEYLARAAKLAHREIELAREELDALDGVSRGRLIIGALPLARSYIVPKAMIEIATHYPKARVRMVEGTYMALLEGLRDGDIDILIGASRDPAPAENLVQTTLFEERLRVVAKANHPALSLRAESLGTASSSGSSIDNLSMAELIQFPWVAPRAGSPARKQFDTLFGEAQTTPTILMEAASHTAMRAILLESDCLALISRHQIHYEKMSGQLVELPIDIKIPPRLVGYTCRSDWKPTQLQTEFLKALEKHCA